MLNINLTKKKALIVGIGDDQGFGWAIAKALAEAGAEIIIATWVPLYKIFTQALHLGKFDASSTLSDGTKMKIEKIYPIDATFDSLDDIPNDIRENKRYKDFSGYSIQEFVDQLEKDFGKIDYFVHSLANAPEVTKPLLETSRNGYLAALSASSYSFISLLAHLGPIMNEGGATLSLTYLASEKTIPGYGGGMSSAKAALESDTRTLAYEAGRKWKIRVNAISAGPYRSRAAKAIGFIDKMIDYSEANSPLQSHLEAEEVAYTAAFLLSPLSSGITGEIVHVDKGLHTMGVALKGCQD